MRERDKRVKAFEKLMRGGLSSTDVFCMKTQLIAMGFFTAPASTKYHGNYEGGLFDHSFTVTSSLLSLKELGDCLWMIAEACDALGTDIDTVMQMNIDKLKARYPEGFAVENSLHRKVGDI